MNAPIAGKNGFSWLLDVIVCAVSRLILAVNNKRAYFLKKKTHLFKTNKQYNTLALKPPSVCAHPHHGHARVSVRPSRCERACARSQFPVDGCGARSEGLPLATRWFLRKRPRPRSGPGRHQTNTHARLWACPQSRSFASMPRSGSANHHGRRLTYGAILGAVAICCDPTLTLAQCGMRALRTHLNAVDEACCADGQCSDDSPVPVDCSDAKCGEVYLPFWNACGATLSSEGDEEARAYAGFSLKCLSTLHPPGSCGDECTAANFQCRVNEMRLACCEEDHDCVPEGMGSAGKILAPNKWYWAS